MMMTERQSLLYIYYLKQHKLSKCTAQRSLIRELVVSKLHHKVCNGIVPGMPSSPRLPSGPGSPGGHRLGLLAQSASYEECS